MDFAGGTAVHITSGATVLASNIFCIVDENGLSTTFKKMWRSIRGQEGLKAASMVRPISGEVDDDPSTANLADTIATDSLATSAEGSGFWSSKKGDLNDDSPHNVNNMVLGTALLWIGWFGFNGGSALGGNLRAVVACVNTHVAACAGSVTMLFMFWLMGTALRRQGKGNFDEKLTSATNFCDGAIVGLVAITPGAGYVCPLLSCSLFFSFSLFLFFFSSFLFFFFSFFLFSFSFSLLGFLLVWHGVFLTEMYTYTSLSFRCPSGPLPCSESSPHSSSSV
jgi:ammonia channel protein AmtB